VKIQLVPLEWVARTWPAASPFIDDAMLFSQGEYTAEQVAVHVSDGRWKLIVAVDESNTVRGAMVLNVFNRPTHRVAFIISVGGRLVSSHDTFAQLKELCASFGATHIEGAAREAVARLWTRYGLEEKYRIVGVKL
jgi:electron transfer flavoprotein alpha subunit